MPNLSTCIRVEQEDDQLSSYSQSPSLWKSTVNEKIGCVISALWAGPMCAFKVGDWLLVTSFGGWLWTGLSGSTRSSLYAEVPMVLLCPCSIHLLIFCLHAECGDQKDDWHTLLLLSCLQRTACECFWEHLWNSFLYVIPTVPPPPVHLSVASPFFLEVPRFFRIEQTTCSYGIDACHVYSVRGKSDKNKVCRSKPKIYVYWRS